MTVRIVVSLASMFFIISCPTVLLAADWYVDASVEKSGNGKEWKDAFKTIQEGVDAASGGDTVTVAEGTYAENIFFNGKNITVQSKDALDTPTVQSTIVDGNAAGTVITFSGTEDASCILSGFTIRNGRAMYGGGISGGTGSSGTQAKIQFNYIVDNFADYGGGIRRCDGIIQNNRIESNTAYWGGGLDLCNGTIRMNTIRANEATWTGGGLRNCGGTIEHNNEILLNVANDAGGGLSGCHGTIKENTILGNAATDRGGGLNECNGSIERNSIHGNSCSTSGGGLFRCGGTIKNNMIRANQAWHVGGGLYDCDGEIRNNVIASNSAVSATGDGGALAYCDGQITNNTFIKNQANRSGGAMLMCWTTVRNCIFWENTSPQLSDSFDPRYSCCQDWTGGGEGNISESPGFVNFDENDYHLSAGSPCIDAGGNEDWMWAAVDLDGNLRVFPGISSVIVDMGAYEFIPELPRKTLFIVAEGDGVRLIWDSTPGSEYSIWSCLDLGAVSWTHEATLLVSRRTAFWRSSFATTPSRRFYKLGFE